MAKLASCSLALSLVLAFCGHSLAAVWVNDAPDAFVKRIEIYGDSGAVVVIDNPLLPTEGYANITFFNDVEYAGLALHPTASSISPSFLLAANDYTLFTVYHCEQGGALPGQDVCDGIALRLVDGQLCAGFFQYNTMLDRVATIADIGCFVLEQVLPAPQLSKRDILQRFTKEQLIDIIAGVRPIPVGPLCLTCPPWNGYERDLRQQLRGMRVRKFQVEVNEIR